MTKLFKNKNKLPEPKKSQEDYAEEALYREVWEDVNNEKTMAFLKKYSKILISFAVAVVVITVGIQLVRHNNKAARLATAEGYEIAIENADGRALAALSKNSSGATADLAMFQSFMSDGDVSKLETLAKDGSSRDFRDLAKLHLAGIKGDKMTGSELEKFLSDLNTSSSPFYYNSMLLVAEKYLSEGNKDAANKWLDKIISEKDAPAVISATAQTLK